MDGTGSTKLLYPVVVPTAAPVRDRWHHLLSGMPHSGEDQAAGSWNDFRIPVGLFAERPALFAAVTVDVPRSVCDQAVIQRDAAVIKCGVDPVCHTVVRPGREWFLQSRMVMRKDNEVSAGK